MQKHGLLDAVLAKWNGRKAKRDNFAEGGAAFRPLINFFNEKSPRDRDTAQFLFELQRKFYANTQLRPIQYGGLLDPDLRAPGFHFGWVSGWPLGNGVSARMRAKRAPSGLSLIMMFARRAPLPPDSA